MGGTISVGTTTNDRVELRPVNADHAELLLQVDKVGFGRIGTNTAVSKTVALRNPTKHTVRVESIVASCDCTQVFPSTLTVLPGKSRPIKITLDPERYKGASEAGFEVTLSVQTPDKICEFRIGGVAFDSVVPSFGTVAFDGPIRLGESSTSMPNRFSLPPEVSEYKIKVPDGMTIVEQAERKIGRMLEVTFRIERRPTSDIGVFFFPVKILTSLKNGTQQEFTWRCAGTVESDINFFPSSLFVDGNHPQQLRIWAASGEQIPDLAVSTVSSMEISKNQSKSSHVIFTCRQTAPSISERVQFGTLFITGQSPKHQTNFRLGIPYTLRPAISDTDEI